MQLAPVSSAAPIVVNPVSAEFRAVSAQLRSVGATLRPLLDESEYTDAEQASLVSGMLGRATAQAHAAVAMLSDMTESGSRAFRVGVEETVLGQLTLAAEQQRANPTSQDFRLVVIAAAEAAKSYADAIAAGSTVVAG